MQTNARSVGPRRFKLDGYTFLDDGRRVRCVAAPVGSDDATIARMTDLAYRGSDAQWNTNLGAHIARAATGINNVSGRKAA